MSDFDLDDITINPLKRIGTVGGDVLHALKKTDPGFFGFGELYFSLIEQGAIKAWKCHKKMTLNLVVPIGEIQFVFHSALKGKDFRTEKIGEKRYVRLTVPPGIWFGFQGIAPNKSLLANLADRPHDPGEVLKKEEFEFSYNWSTQ